MGISNVLGHPTVATKACRRADSIVRPQPYVANAEQESVWDYPRPPIAQPCPSRILIEHNGTIVADTQASVRTLETSHPPSYYIPASDINPATMRHTDSTTFCEWKGRAVYWDIVVGNFILSRVAWSYPEPTNAFSMLRDHVAFYAGPFDRCSVDGETVIPQLGAFYGGWITSKVTGPFKGVAGSMGW